MALSAFTDRSHQPTQVDLEATLGKTFRLWNDLQARLAARLSSPSTLWAFGGKSIGWGLRLKSNDRIVLYLTPCHDHFLVSFVLGPRAVAAARASTLPASIISAIDGARRYAEGTGVRFEIRHRQTLQDMEALAVIKMEN
jgi:Protein of unknown function (DUF3788)